MDISTTNEADLDHPYLDTPKRTTVVVRDLEPSIEFYELVLRFNSFYRGDIGNPGATAFAAQPCSGIRMQIYQIGRAELGLIGLMQLIEPAQPLGPPRSGALTAGDTIIVIPTHSMKATFRRLESVKADILLPPTKMDVPDRPPLSEMMVRAPDGLVLNFSQRDHTRT